MGGARCVYDSWEGRGERRPDAAGERDREPDGAQQGGQGEEALGNVRVWTITEILTSRALSLEGQAMRHCVATYAERCARRQASIWSMQVENQHGRHRVLTIEVDVPKRTVCQARRKCNRLPQATEREVVRRWATLEGLNVAKAIGMQA